MPIYGGQQRLIVDFPISNPLGRGMKSGAAGWNRTSDPWLRRPILYPLSYSRVGGISEVMRRIPFFFTYVYGNCRIAGNCMSLLNFCAYNCGFHKGLHPGM